MVADMADTADISPQCMGGAMADMVDISSLNNLMVAINSHLMVLPLNLWGLLAAKVRLNKLLCLKMSCLSTLLRNKTLVGVLVTSNSRKISNLEIMLAEWGLPVARVRNPQMHLQLRCRMDLLSLVLSLVNALIKVHPKVHLNVHPKVHLNVHPKEQLKAL
jgi:hypothetical protein